jgi:hypothetical protein
LADFRDRLFWQSQHSGVRGWCNHILGDSKMKFDFTDKKVMFAAVFIGVVVLMVLFGG